MLRKRTIHKLTLASAIALTMGIGAPALAAPMPDNVYPIVQSPDAQDVRERLQELGFTQVEIVEHSGHITNVNAMWEGKPVMLSVDDRDGGIDTWGGAEAISTVGDMSDNYVRRQLEALGYTQVQEINRSGNVIETSAVHNGKSVKLSIDADNGGITRDHADDTAIITTRQPMDLAYLERQLATIGYSDVRNVERSGNVYELEARKDGQWKELRIDGDDGGVSVMK